MTMTEIPAEMIPADWTGEHQEHLEAMLAAREAEDAHIRWLVSDELKKYLPEYIAAETEAAEKVQACYLSLRSPESDLDLLEKEIGKAEGACIEWEAKLTNTVTELRVEAHRRWSDWDHELRMLYADREAQLKIVEPLRDAHAQARAELAHATLERETAEMNIIMFPFLGNGHKTASYQAWYADGGWLIPVLLSGNETHMEWLAAFEWLDRICIVSGYRSEGRIPTNAEDVKRAFENYAAANYSPQSAPGMTDIMGQTQASVKSMQPVPSDHWEFAPQVNPNRVQPDPSRAYQPLRNVRP